MSKFRGGYKLIDFKNVDITIDSETAVVIPGVYESIETSYRKPLILTGIKVDTVEYGDRPIIFASGSGAYGAVIDVDGAPYTLTITEDDEVMISTPETPEEPGGSEET